MSGGRVSHRKGKAAIPKPARGSGLNPSGLPIADQLHLTAEQPRMPAFNFDPYAENEGWQFEGQQLPPDSTQGSSSYDTPVPAQPSYGDGQDPPPPTDEPEFDFFDHFRGASLDPSLSYDSFRNQQDFHAPVPQWIEDAHDGGAGLIPPASDLALLRQGEIPTSDVVHTGGPARTTTSRAIRRTTMPATPYSTSRTPAVTTEMRTDIVVSGAQETLNSAEHEVSPPPQNVVSLTPESIAHAVWTAKTKVTRILFSKNAMVYSKQRRKELVDRVIKDSVPNEFGPNVVFQEFITSTHRKQVHNALSSKRGKIVEFSCEGCCDTFQLFPPQGHHLPLDQYRAARVNRFTLGADPLIFMYNVHFDENDVMIVRAKFQNKFIKANIIRFIWYWGFAPFLGASPLKTIKYIMAVAGAATHRALHEQGKGCLEIDPFGGEAHHRKFKDIIRAFDSLSPAEKAEFDVYLQYVLEIGPSQARGSGARNPSTSDSE